MYDGTFKKDLSGNVVTTKLNEQIGKNIAQAGGGMYIHVDQNNMAQAILEKEIGKALLHQGVGGNFHGDGAAAVLHHFGQHALQQGAAALIYMPSIWNQTRQSRAIRSNQSTSKTGLNGRKPISSVWILTPPAFRIR